MRQAPRLRTLWGGAVLLAFAGGGLACWLWLSSALAWDRHLMASQAAGFAIHESLRTGAVLPAGLSMRALAPDEAALADLGAFARLPDLPTPAFVTAVSVLTPGPDPVAGAALQLGIVSDRLRYAVADLPSAPGRSAAQKLGDITRLMATYCSEPVLFVRLGAGDWRRVDGGPVWGCAAAPADLRLPAVLVGAAVLLVLLTLAADSSAQFDRFARELGARQRLGGPESYRAAGPAELREIVTAVNAYLEEERTRLSKRAEMLSGVSHDLGTPATRLRLRSALIADTALREKLQADIDRMTGMIEGVLTYTRSELDTEAPRRVSVRSLVEALVADYQDVGKPVTFRMDEPRLLPGARSLFSAHRGTGTLPDVQRVLATIRPQSLTRAVSNLIDNALKYGRRAHVVLAATGDDVTILVEDEGTDLAAEAMNVLLAPFARGANAQTVAGFGLGLSIVATVAERHGGSLWFEDGESGLRACLRIARDQGVMYT